MFTDYAATNSGVALSASATKTMLLLVPGANEASITQIDVTMDASTVTTAVQFDLYYVTLGSGNGGAAGTATTLSKLIPGVAPNPTTTALANLSAEPTTAFTVASVTPNTTANNSRSLFSSNNFTTSGVVVGQAMSGTGIGASAAVSAVDGTQLIATVASTATGTVTVTFTPVLTVVQSWFIQPVGGGGPIQLPLGREYVQPGSGALPGGGGFRFGLRAVTPTGVTPHCLVNMVIEE